MNEQTQPADQSPSQEQAIVHTPGPWESYDDWYVKSSGGIGAIATVCKPILPHVSDEECKGNARLIAAAPELLAACRDMIEAMDDYECSVDDPPTPKHREMMLRAMKAVEKATHQVV